MVLRSRQIGCWLLLAITPHAVIMPSSGHVVHHVHSLFAERAGRAFAPHHVCAWSRCHGVDVVSRRKQDGSYTSDTVGHVVVAARSMID